MDIPWLFIKFIGPYGWLFLIMGPFIYFMCKQTGSYDTSSPFTQSWLRFLGIYLPIFIILFKIIFFTSLMSMVKQKEQAVRSANINHIQRNDNIKTYPNEHILQAREEDGKIILKVGRYYLGGKQKFQREFKNIETSVMKEYCDAYYGEKPYRGTINFMDMESHEILGKIDIDTTTCQKY